MKKYEPKKRLAGIEREKLASKDININKANIIKMGIGDWAQSPIPNLIVMINQ